MPEMTPSRFSAGRRASTSLTALLLLAAGSLWSWAAFAQGALSDGDAAVTQFSGYERAPDGTPRPDPQGAVFRVLGLSSPGFAADGSLWETPPLRLSLTASDVGQVFGIAIDGAEPANIYLAASSAFGLYRDSGEGGWADGMWGPGGGPGTIWKLDAERGYRPEPFAEIGFLDAPNGGAGLGDLAYDRWHNQLLVSDLESGLIHRLDLETGELLESFDHGVDGRASFVDAASGEEMSLDPVMHDPNSEPRFEDCSITEDGEDMAMPFDSAPECWNYADFRRRVWGLGVHQDPETEDVRLYYAVWGGAALGGEEWDGAEDEEKRTSIWSIALTNDGWFDPTDVRREIVLPAIEEEDAEAPPPETPPVTDIAASPDGALILAERGRPAPYFEEEEFAQLIDPKSARVLRLAPVPAGGWQLDGRYPAGLPERSEALPPQIRANAAGGVSVGRAYGEEGRLDPEAPGATVWMTVSPLCADEAPCEFRGETDQDRPDTVAGLQGTPLEAIADLDSENNGLASTYFVRVNGAGEVPGDVGDIEIYRSGAAADQIVQAPRRIEPRREDAEDPEDTAEAEEADEAEEEVEATSLPTDLAVAVEDVEDCGPGTECAFEVSITNEGDVSFAGPLLLSNTIRDADVSLAGASPELWDCRQSGAQVICRPDTLDLEPGDSIAVTLEIRPGEVYWQPRMELCAAITWPGLSGRDRIRAVQAELGELGFDVGPADGILCPRTTAAVRQAQRRYGLPVTGEISGALVEELFGEGSLVTGDTAPDNDTACAIAAVDLPEAPAAQPEPERRAPAQPRPQHSVGMSAFHQQFQSQQHDPATSGPRGLHNPGISAFHARRSSAQHNPVTSGPTPLHQPEFSQFHVRNRSSAHDGVRTQAVPSHDPIMSQFHRRFDSRIHNIETSAPRPLHDARMSRFHNQMRSDFHDGVTSGVPPLHDPRTTGFR